MAVYSLKWMSSWTCSNADTIKAAVAEGLGVSVISERMIAKEMEDGYLCKIEIKDLPFTRHFKLAHHRDKHLTGT